MMKTTTKACCFVLQLVTYATILLAEAHNWPTIEPAKVKQAYVGPGKDGADTPFLLFLKHPSGVPLYKLECHNGNYEDSSELNFPVIFSVPCSRSRAVRERVGTC
jgi:hypothetical protein